MSNFDEMVLSEQLYILRDFLFHYSSFSYLNNNFENFVNQHGSQEFWVLTINSHYFQAINLWCMIFGTNNNETHWRKLGDFGDFKPVILDRLKIEQNDYDLYWKSITDWRNQYSAHRVPGFLKPTPELKLARSVALVYEDWISFKIDASISFSLELYEEEYKEKLDETFFSLLSKSTS
ncbi:hypothetical protein [Mesobacillus jeotgali]|uniref:hypothetical protein n=1 Tax=Mesobacillus jeotgali TaxID=129985 RepID=UPI0009A62460|nr:hypothetical protein [Mesobacillus jeotgali]